MWGNTPTDSQKPAEHHGGMSTDAEDWHLKEWMQHFGKKQAALVNELGWDKAKANFLWHSKQPYRRDVVNEVAGWLEIRPFELLMTPEEALALRRLREAAALIVADSASPTIVPRNRPSSTPKRSALAR